MMNVRSLKLEDCLHIHVLKEGSFSLKTEFKMHMYAHYLFRDITTSLEVNHGPVNNLHKCDVETSCSHTLRMDYSVKLERPADKHLK